MRYASCHVRTSKMFQAKCAPRLMSNCAKKKIHVVKLIRLNIDSVEALLTSMSNATFIYQVRDPRGIIASRIKNKVLMTYPLEKEVQTMCSNMYYDAKVVQELSVKFPGRVHLLRYEDLTMTPATELQRIYDAIGETLPETVLKAFKSEDSEERFTTFQEKQGSFNTNRENPREVAVAWKEDLDEQVLGLVTHQCKEFLEMMRYDVEGG